MATRFIRETPYSWMTVAPGTLELLVDTVFELGTILLAEFEHIDEDHPVVAGMIALLALEHPITGETYCEELVWWVEPEYRSSSIGPRLLVAGEAWARKKALPMVKMVSPAGSHVGAFYLRRGYVAVETAYMKRL